MFGLSMFYIQKLTTIMHINIIDCAVCNLTSSGFCTRGFPRRINVEKKHVLKHAQILTFRILFSQTRWKLFMDTKYHFSTRLSWENTFAAFENKPLLYRFRMKLSYKRRKYSTRTVDAYKMIDLISWWIIGLFCL